MDILLSIAFNILTSIGVFVLLWKLFEKAITTKIENAIKHDYDIKLEQYRNQLQNRQKAALISDLLSEWISKPEDKKLLNKLSFEAFIWLPKPTALKLSELLSHAEGAPTLRDVISEVRTLILGEHEIIDPVSIITFTKGK